DPSRRPDDRQWKDARIPLDRFAGRTVRIALRTRSGAPSRGGTSLPAWADPVVLAPSPAHVPNVVVVSLDSLRARSVSAYGAPRPTTPNLDRMVGEQGTIFDAAFATAPHSPQSHLGAFTGFYPA